ncbi:hypothetical protein B7P43_G07025 [Cryptotermes secundus]|uniref:Uncharacterized protein n=1 Tax=Cryptotermes secundus TaxID=105785 RepID=A0A2J7PEP4_9NEOP|nr:hypothetical protein B7P43_G07025 [Cryptotermes secundus]
MAVHMFCLRAMQILWSDIEFPDSGMWTFPKQRRGSTKYGLEILLQASSNKLFGK